MSDLKRMSLSKLIDELGKLSEAAMRANQAFIKAEAELEKVKEELVRRASKRGPRKKKRKWGTPAQIKGLEKARKTRSANAKKRRKKAAKSRR